MPAGQRLQPSEPLNIDEAEREEFSRLQDLRALKKVRDLSGKILQRREELRQSNPTFKRALIEFCRNSPQALNEPYQELFQKTLLQNQQLKDYLDDVLYGDIVDKLEEAPKDLPKDCDVSIHTIAQDIQGTLFEHFTDCPARLGRHIPYDLTVKCLSGVFQAIQKALADHIQDSTTVEYERAHLEVYLSRDQHIPNGAFSLDVRGFVSDNFPKMPLSIGPLMDRFITNLCREMIQGILDDWDDPLHPKHPIAAKLVTQLSREEYAVWMFAGEDQVQIDECVSLCLASRHRERRQKAVQKFRASMNSVNLTIEQKFLPDILKPGVVTLVLFKGGHPATLRNVLPSEPEEIGWVLEAHGSESEFRRYELQERQIFHVSMDGEILGVVTEDYAYYSSADLSIAGATGRHVMVHPTESGSG